MGARSAVGDRGRSSRTLAFESHAVGRLQSVAHLFARSKGRCGVYVLKFGNGESYVGQSIDVVTRFGDHLRKVGDILEIEFARVPRSGLDAVEEDLIRKLEGDGVRLRNKKHVLASTAYEVSSDLDLVVTPQQQNAWLCGEVDVPDTADRVGDPVLRAGGESKCAALRAHTLGPYAAFLARLYVQWAVPRPRATEMTFWAASAMPSTNRSTWPRLVAVSVNKMETFVAGWDREEPELLWGFLNVRRSTLEEKYGSVRAFVGPRQNWLDVEEAGYEAGGGDVARINVVDGPSFGRLFMEDDNDGVVAAAGDLALALMRKGPTLQWRWHNFSLADELVTPLAE